MGKYIGKVTDAVGLTDIKGTEARANQAAAAQREAAQLGSQVAAFRPVGMTTRFGTSQFDITDVGGVPRVTGAEYQISPELRAIQDRLFAAFPGMLGTAESAQSAAAPLGMAAGGLFNLGQQYLAQSPEQARQQYIQEQTAMLDPIRAREEQRLASSVFGRGRAGLNIGDMGQPELFALASARRGQDLQLAAQAEQAAQQRAQYGAGLFGTGAQLLGNQYAIPTQALGPLQSYLGMTGAVEELGQQPFRLGLAVGGAAQPGATAGSQLLSSGLSQAAATQQAGAQAASNQLTGFMNQMLGAAVGGFGGGFGGTGGLQARFAQTGLGSSGFGTGLAYGNQDYGMYF
jgi:hypothetical protein